MEFLCKTKQNKKKIPQCLIKHIISKLSITMKYNFFMALKSVFVKPWKSYIKILMCLHLIILNKSKWNYYYNFFWYLVLDTTIFIVKFGFNLYTSKAITRVIWEQKLLFSPGCWHKEQPCWAFSLCTFCCWATFQTLL